MHLNRPETIHHYPSLGPCFHKTSPDAQKGGAHYLSKMCHKVMSSLLYGISDYKVS